MIDKYGKALKLGKGKHYQYIGHAIEYAIDTVERQKRRHPDSKISEYLEWDKEITEDVHVKIDLVKFPIYLFTGKSWYTYLSYDCYSVAENELVQETKMQEIKDSI